MKALLEAELHKPPLHLDLPRIRKHFAARSGPAQIVMYPAEVELNEPLTKTARDAAVLILLTPEPDGLHVTMTKRTDHLAKHPGQISFPGGSRDPEDADDTGTALREAQEEVELDSKCVEILGPLGCYYTVTGFRVTPIVGISALHHRELDLSPDPHEVAEILSVPLVHLMTPSRYSVHASRYAGYLRYYYSVPWAGRNIWGATAGMLMGMYREFSEARPHL